VLWEMVTGVRLFRGEDAAASVNAVLTELPAPLGKFTPVSPYLETIVAQALAKNPQHRFSTALAIETLLQRYVTEEAAAGTPDLRRFMREHFGKHQTAWRQRVRRALSQPTPFPMPTPEVTPVVVSRSPRLVPGDVAPRTKPHSRRSDRILALAGLVFVVMVPSPFLAVEDTHGAKTHTNSIPSQVRTVRVEPLAPSTPFPTPPEETSSFQLAPMPAKDRGEVRKLVKSNAPSKVVPQSKVPQPPGDAKPNPFRL
jgi:hypothetical protein